MTANNITILPMSRTSLDAVYDMERRQFSIPWSYNSLEKSLKSDTIFYYVAMQGEELLGYIGISLSYDSADITTFCVDSNYRRNGIGTKLLAYVIEICRNKALQSIFLEVRESNRAARAFYERAGFVFLSRRKNYYKQPTEDALVLQKEI